MPMIPSSAQLSNLTANNPAASAMAEPAPAPPPPPPPPPPPGDDSGAHPTHVSEPAYEFLLGSILHWVEAECSVERLRQQRQQQQRKEAAAQEKDEKKEEAEAGGDRQTDEGVQDTAAEAAAAAAAATEAASGPSDEELTILSAERAAAKIERLGFDVGYRLCERLAQSKPLGPGLPPPGSSGAAAAGGGAGGTAAPAVDPAALQLEAVKFLCKEFWMEVFRKQIDKLQTNHRGVFVLKDHELRWLRRLPPEDETARVAAIKLLAFPCGLIRGALSNLGIGAVVSCDFLADGKNMAACSFNVKIKS